MRRRQTEDVLGDPETNLHLEVGCKAGAVWEDCEVVDGCCVGFWLEDVVEEVVEAPFRGR